MNMLYILPSCKLVKSTTHVYIKFKANNNTNIFLEFKKLSYHSLVHSVEVTTFKVNKDKPRIKNIQSYLKENLIRILRIKYISCTWNIHRLDALPIFI